MTILEAFLYFGYPLAVVGLGLLAFWERGRKAKRTAAGIKAANAQIRVEREKERKMADGPKFIKAADAKLVAHIDVDPAVETQAVIDALRGVGPASYSLHEALHMALVIAEMVDQHLCSHAAIIHVPEWASAADDIRLKLVDLYNAIGREHLGEYVERVDE